MTGYENKHPESGNPLLQIYLYDAAADELSCASCKPDGTPMRAGAAIKWPANPGDNNSWKNAYHPQRNVSDSGQVFFETADALLPQDTNGRRDVYQYAGGELSLISSGSGESGSHFLDATPDGTSVFFSTAQRLLPREDTDTVYDYYVARVNGGFPQPPVSPPPCEGEGCRAPGSVEEVAAPGTAHFAGAGNLSAAARCGSLARRAGNLSRSAKRLRANARRLARSGDRNRARHALQKANRQAKRADRLSRSAKSCRRANGGAGR